MASLHIQFPINSKSDETLAVAMAGEPGDNETLVFSANSMHRLLEICRVSMVLGYTTSQSQAIIDGLRAGNHKVIVKTHL